MIIPFSTDMPLALDGLRIAKIGQRVSVIGALLPATLPTPWIDITGSGALVYEAAERLDEIRAAYRELVTDRPWLTVFVQKLSCHYYVNQANGLDILIRAEGVSPEAA